MVWSNDNVSARKQRLPDNWPELRAFVKRRAHGRCEAIKADGTRCKAFGNQCDHILAGDNHDPTNLQWLCDAHHAQKSSAEGHTAARTARAKAFHPRERHPGLA